jgi:hypothetical protein
MPCSTSISSYDTREIKRPCPNSIHVDIDYPKSRIKAMKAKSKRGGRREGAGRKKLPPEVRARVIALCLRPDEIEQLEQLGDGSLTAGVRKLLTERQTANKT